MLSPEIRARLETPDAVANAMMATQWKIVSNLYIPDKKSEDNWELELALRLRYQDFCIRASVYPTYYLHTKHPELFDKLAVLGGIATEDVPMKSSWKWSFHTYFLAKGKNSIWYAGSPSNYTQDTDLTNPITTVYQSRDIKQVLEGIRQKDGGIWPLGTDILRTTTEMYRDPTVYQDPEGKKSIDVLYIRSQTDGTNVSMHTFPIVLEN